MNFSTLKGLTIPEGNVTQIADASGNVLWSAAPSGVTVKVTLSLGGVFASQTSSAYASFSIDGVRHAVAEEIVVPVGTVLTCNISRSQGTGSQQDGIYVNGATVAYTTNSQYGASYNYTVTGDVEIVLRSSMTMSQSSGGMAQIKEAFIYITEL